MLCPNCQFENLSSSSFCSKCGKPFTKSRNVAPKKKATPKKNKSTTKKTTKKKSAKKRSPSPTATSPSALPPKTTPGPIPEPEPQPLLLAGPVLLPESDEAKERAKITMPSQEDYIKQKEFQKKVENQVKAESLTQPELKPTEPDRKPDEKPEPKETETDTISEEPKKPLKLKLDPPHAQPKHMGTMFQQPAPEAPAPVKPKTPKVKLQIRATHKLRPFLIFIIIAFIGIAAWQLFLHSESDDPNEDTMSVVEIQTEPRIVVLDFQNETSNDRFSSWSQAIPFLLTSYLSQSNHLQVISQERLYWTQMETGQKNQKRLASAVNSDRYIEGSYSSEGNSLNLNVSIKRTSSGKVAFKHSVNNIRESDIFNRVAELTQMIYAHFKLPVSKGIQFFSPNPEAYKSFVQGQRLYWKKNYRESIAAYEETVTSDQDFAKAYVEMAKTYSALGYPGKAGQYYQLAQAHINSVPERDRFYIQAEFYRQSEKTYDIAREVFSRLLQEYPEDPQGNTNLAMLFTQLGMWDDAWRRIQINLQNRVDTWESCYGQALNIALQGDYDQAEKILKNYKKNISENEYLISLLAWIHLMQEDADKALKEINRGIKIHPSYRMTAMKGDVLLLKDDLAAATAEYAKLVENVEPSIQALGRQKLANVRRQEGKFGQARGELLQGLKLMQGIEEDEWSYRFHLDLARGYLEMKKPQQALMECAKAWDIATKGKTNTFPREVLHLRGLALVSLRRIREAQKTASDLKSLCEKGPSQDRMRYYFHLAGKIEMARRNFTKAREFFEQAISLLPPQGPPGWQNNDQALFYDSVGESFYADGNIGAAFEEFAKVISLMTGRLIHGDVYARAYYKMAKISEENMLNDTAARFYAKFLKFWNDGDSGHSEISDARKRLQATKGSDRPK